LINNNVDHVSRLLHYYPVKEKIELSDNWCGWHNDHSCLTGLTSAMYLDSNLKEIDFVDEEGGLRAKNRSSEIVSIRIPKDCVGF
jgi:hypothetical protein